MFGPVGIGSMRGACAVVRGLATRISAGIEPVCVNAFGSQAPTSSFVPPLAGISVAEEREYIAFRVPEGSGLVTVVAALEPGDRGRFPWAVWYSELTPNGEFKKVPGGYANWRIAGSVAQVVIDLIQAGRPAPDAFVAGLPIA
jgi:hypothetical protein